jgi:hypothetical protein
VKYPPLLLLLLKAEETVSIRPLAHARNAPSQTTSSLNHATTPLALLLDLGQYLTG